MLDVVSREESNGCKREGKIESRGHLWQFFIGSHNGTFREVSAFTQLSCRPYGIVCLFEASGIIGANTGLGPVVPAK